MRVGNWRFGLGAAGMLLLLGFPGSPAFARDDSGVVPGTLRVDATFEHMVTTISTVRCRSSLGSRVMRSG